jgi:hypothetical protein
LLLPLQERIIFVEDDDSSAQLIRDNDSILSLRCVLRFSWSWTWRYRRVEKGNVKSADTSTLSPHSLLVVASLDIAERIHEIPDPLLYRGGCRREQSAFLFAVGIEIERPGFTLSRPTTGNGAEVGF